MGLWIRNQDKQQLNKIVEIYIYNEREEGKVKIAGGIENGATVYLRNI